MMETAGRGKKFTGCSQRRPGAVRAEEELALYWSCRALHYARCTTDILSYLGEHPKMRLMSHLSLDELERADDKVFRQRVAASAVSRPQSHRNGTIFSNVRMLSGKMGLSAVESEILLFGQIKARDSLLNKAMDATLGNLNLFNMSAYADFLGFILDTEPGAVKKALQNESPLMASGLVSIPQSGFMHSDGSIDFILNLGIDKVLEKEHGGENEMMSCFFSLAPRSTLAVKDFKHLKDELTLLKAALGNGRRLNEKGVHVCIWGPPGTGKTELGRLVAGELGLDGYEIPFTGDYDGEAPVAQFRFSSYQVCQRLMASDSRAVVIFDDFETFFVVNSEGSSSRFRMDKGTLNRVFETTPVPTIWIANDISSMDDAFLRRFRLHVWVGVPPRKVRREMLARNLTNSGLRRGFINKISTCRTLTPADTVVLSKMAEALGPETRKHKESLLLKSLEQRLLARCEPFQFPEKEGKHNTADGYDLAFLNTDADLEKLARSLDRNSTGTVLLYGPPGTGKTAFARHVADMLKKPLVCKRASDLFGMYVGQTERQIAMMFREAAKKRAVLLLDEADSFLRERRRANTSWEVTQVNEMLVQMEGHKGLFFCSTNIVDDFDQASFRRFALKVKFDYMRPEQAWWMLAMDLQKLCLDVPDPSFFNNSLPRNLTPGDFAAVRNRIKMLKTKPAVSEHLQLLEHECRTKVDGREERVVGF